MLALLRDGLLAVAGNEKQNGGANVGAWTSALVNRPAISCLLLLGAIGAGALGFRLSDAGGGKKPVSLELVVIAPQQHIRTTDQDAETDGRRYRMTLAERQALAREVEDRLAGVQGIVATRSARTEMFGNFF